MRLPAARVSRQEHHERERQHGRRGGKSPQDLVGIITSRGYHALLLVAALLGLPVAVCAPSSWRHSPGLRTTSGRRCPTVGVGRSATLVHGAGACGRRPRRVGLVIVYLPGRGGHLPVKGFGGDSTVPVQLPGVILAAVGGLALGVVLGPESPLIALGGGLMLLALDRTKAAELAAGLTLLAAAGSAAAVATVFGNPLVAVVLMLECGGSRRRPGSVSVAYRAPPPAGLAALMFTGLGSWTGINVQTLTIPGCHWRQHRLRRICSGPCRSQSSAPSALRWCGGWVSSDQVHPEPDRTADGSRRSARQSVRGGVRAHHRPITAGCPAVG